jgi:hypothetical protein
MARDPHRYHHQCMESVELATSIIVVWVECCLLHRHHNRSKRQPRQQDALEERVLLHHCTGRNVVLEMNPSSEDKYLYWLASETQHSFSVIIQQLAWQLSSSVQRI